MISLQSVTKVFGGRTVLSNVSFQVEPGEFICVTGPSGAGKSTLLSLLVGAEKTTDGSIDVDGVDLRKVPPGALQIFRRRMGVVFQDYKLLQNRTVAENVAFPLEVCGETDAAIKTRVEHLLERMDLTDHADAFPAELSGGEQARTAIARAIAHDPLILLADEPTGNLDIRQAQLVLEIFRELHGEGKTVILATHDVGLVDGFPVRVIHLNRGRMQRDTTIRQPAPPITQEALFEQPSRVISPKPEPEPEPEEIPNEPPNVKAKKSKKSRVTAPESPEPATVPERRAVHKQKSDEATPRKKVKITSIHSD